jgi:hypothetical protein
MYDADNLSKEEIYKRFKECDLDKLKQKIRDREAIKALALKKTIDLLNINALCDLKKLEEKYKQGGLNDRKRIFIENTTRR